MNSVTTLWKFSRPHTIIGTVISICTLYTIVCHKAGEHHLFMLFLALLIGISCNIFIVGINQIADINIDKINKPYLPIPAGELSISQATKIAYGALCISLLLALYVTPYLFGIIALAAAIGWAYSMPPFYFKQHHLLAAVAITTVRGLLINVGGFLVFNQMVNNSLELPENVKILTLFIIAFSIAISWFKDLQDMKGDATYQIKTFAIVYSPKTALIIGSLLVGSAYLLTIFMKYKDFSLSKTPAFETIILLGGHVLLLIFFIINIFAIKIKEQQSIREFYMRFWWFFFAEYVLYFIAYS